MPVGDAFSHLSARFHSQDWYLASQNHTKIYQKCICRRVQAVLTKQIFSSPKAFPAGHIGNMSKGKDEGIGEICPSKPTWFDSRTASHNVPPVLFRIGFGEVQGTVGGLCLGSIRFGVGLCIGLCVCFRFGRILGYVCLDCRVLLFRGAIAKATRCGRQNRAGSQTKQTNKTAKTE